MSALKARAELLASVRAYFREQSVLEVETPYLSIAANSDPAIESFSVVDGEQWRYLHTSPEYPMKRLLTKGSGDIYQICKVWRQEECGAHHNPEFTLLEWYRLGFGYQELMQDVECLISTLLPMAEPAVFLSYEEAFLEFVGINPHVCAELELKAAINDHDNQLESVLNRDEMLDWLMAFVIEKKFDKGRLTFLYDFPATQKSMARISPHDNRVAERFEVYLGEMELGNGYREESSALLNHQILTDGNHQREKQGQVVRPLDHNFLDSMQHGLPKVSGVALGLDRLMMCKMQVKSINEVISFPWLMA